jgi:hypothetical protein
VQAVLILFLDVRLCGNFERPGGAEFLDGDTRPAANFLQKIRLSGFELDQPRKHVENVDQFRGVFGEPMIGLDFTELRWFAPIADDGAITIRRSIAEPLGEDMFSAIERRIVIAKRRARRCRCIPVRQGVSSLPHRSLLNPASSRHPRGSHHAPKLAACVLLGDAAVGWGALGWGPPSFRRTNAAK